MEHVAIQLKDNRVPLSSKDERSTEHDTHVQEIHPKAQSQLDWLETQSTIVLGDVRMKEGRRIKKSVGGGRKEGKILCTRRGNYNRSMGC